MAKLEDLFRRGGDHSDITISLYYPKPQHIKELSQVTYYDGKAVEDIQRLKNLADLLEQYRTDLYKRAQQFLTSDYKMRLSLVREIQAWTNKKIYRIEVCKIYDVPNAKPETLISETFAGTERHKAFARFEELKKLYPNIETVKDIDKKFWEK